MTYAKPEIITAAKVQYVLQTITTTTFISSVFLQVELLVPLCHMLMTGDIWAQHMPPPTLIYRPCTHMFLWHIKSRGSAPVYVCYWTLQPVWVHACVRYIHSVTYGWKIHVSASVGHACEWNMSYYVYLHCFFFFSGHVCVCVNLYMERRPVCDSNPDWAAALIRIQPQGTSRPSRWLGIRDREREKERESKEWGTERETKRARESGRQSRRERSSPI